ncbi:class I SAM-dependent methyltransferase [Thermodesulfobacteriota bacterium]
MTKDSSIWLNLYQEETPRAIKKQKYLLKFFKPEHKKILELFVANGQNIDVLKGTNPNASFFGIDYDIKLCRIAKKNGFIVLNADCRKLPFKEGTFDLIYSNSFHHISESVDETMEQCLDLLKSGGLLVGVEPFGIISTIFAGFIYVIPDFIISLIPYKMKYYIHAIKYECRYENVIYWYYKVNFKKILEKYNTISKVRDLFRVYYCIKKM